MKTTIKDNVLHIEIPLHAPRPSATGKTLTVASSNGNKETEARINGKPVVVGVNAYIKPPAKSKQLHRCNMSRPPLELGGCSHADEVPGVPRTGFRGRVRFFSSSVSSGNSSHPNDHPKRSITPILAPH